MIHWERMGSYPESKTCMMNVFLKTNETRNDPWRYLFPVFTLSLITGLRLFSSCVLFYSITPSVVFAFANYVVIVLNVMMMKKAEKILLSKFKSYYQRLFLSFYSFSKIAFWEFVADFLTTWSLLPSLLYLHLPPCFVFLCRIIISAWKLGICAGFDRYNLICYVLNRLEFIGLPTIYYAAVSFTKLGPSNFT